MSLNDVNSLPEEQLGPVFSIAADGTRYRDLNGNGVLDPYEDPRLSTEERTEDLLARLSIEEKVGLMFHTVIESHPDGTLLDGPGAISKTGTQVVVSQKFMNHFNVHALASARAAATWANRLQKLAEETPHGIPVTVSTDPRHSATENAGTSWSSTFLSEWPEPMGVAALKAPDITCEFGNVVRREYTAIGIRAALHPTADLATEPRWGRQRECFGQNPYEVGEHVFAYLTGLKGNDGDKAVSACTKHFPGGGPQKDGEDAHFPYGADQVYPGGHFEDHLAPFRRAIAAGTSVIMPYYGKPVGLVVDGEEIEEVGFGFNKQVLTGLLREKLNFEGVILSDWELVTDNHVGDQVLPARAWGVEHLDSYGRLERILEAGADQFGGEECTTVLLELVEQGRVSEARIDESARRLLREKFALGLFDDPYVDIDEAEATVGTAESVARGLEIQAMSIVPLVDHEQMLPLAKSGALRLYIEGVNPEIAAEYGILVHKPEDADLALVRIGAPFQPRNDLFLESWFHQGDLSYPPGLAVRLERIRTSCPLILDVELDRPAILTDIVDHVDVLTGSFGASSRAWLSALFGTIMPQGKLPFELPSSMDAVRASFPDAPSDTANPLFPIDFGLDVRDRYTH